MELDIVNENIAFFICDLQERFREHIHSFRVIEHNCIKMIKLSKILEIPLVITTQNKNKLGPLVKELEKESQFQAYFEDKMSFSMISESIENYLREKRIQRVYLCGIESHICILLTAKDLIKKGYMVTVVSNCCSSRSPKDRREALDQMRHWDIEVLPMESSILGLIASSLHPNFKEISKEILRDTCSDISD